MEEQKVEDEDEGNANNNGEENEEIGEHSNKQSPN